MMVGRTSANTGDIPCGIYGDMGMDISMLMMSPVN
jgi:hypothetical protein